MYRPSARFHRICGFGKPSATQFNMTSDPRTASVWEGSVVHRGGAEKKIYTC